MCLVLLLWGGKKKSYFCMYAYNIGAYDIDTLAIVLVFENLGSLLGVFGLVVVEEKQMVHMYVRL